MRYILTVVMMLFVTAPATAEVWAEVGDKQLKEDIELLHSVGLVQGPILSWPLPWDQIAEDVVQASQASNISPFLQQAAWRVRQRMSDDRSEGWRPDIEVSLRGTNSEAIVKDFSDHARSKANASIRFKHEFENSGTSLVYGAGVQQSQTYQGKRYGGKAILDNLYVTQKLGNWLFYAGTVEQWWGPSGEQSLMLSNSARPYPKVGFKRISTEAFDSRWLHWLGPWRFEFNAGLLTGPRSDYKNVLVMNQRLELQPTRHFQIALARYAQLCGSQVAGGLASRKCSFGTIAKALVLTGSANSGSVATDSSNSGAEIDLVYARPIGNVAVRAYVHLYAEDSPFTATSQMAGIAISGHTDGLGLWKIGAEGVDTYAFRTHDFSFGTRSPSVTYLNGVYTDGYSYRGRPIAASIDGDSQMVSIFGSLIDRQNMRYSGAVRYLLLNLTSTPNYRISKTRESLWLLEGSVNVPSPIGDLDLKARFQTDSPDTPGRKVARAAIEARWTMKF